MDWLIPQATYFREQAFHYTLKEAQSKSLLDLCLVVVTAESSVGWLREQVEWYKDQVGTIRMAPRLVGLRSYHRSGVDENGMIWEPAPDFDQQHRIDEYASKLNSLETTIGCLNAYKSTVQDFLREIQKLADILTARAAELKG